MTTYAATCLGDGHTPCPDQWTATDPGADAAAEKHTKATKHATTTHVAGGAFAGRTS